MIEKVFFVAAFIGFMFYAIRYPSKEHVDSWTMFAFLCGALMFGAIIGIHHEEESKTELLNKHCHERAKNVYLCDFRYPDENDQQSSGTGRYND